MGRVFSVNAWRFSASLGVGKWDRFTSFGTKVKDGVESVFDEANLSQMVENFARQKNDVAMCYDHQSAYVADNGQPAPALAWYNALALVIDGKVVKFATHDPSVTPPDPAGLENGVYGYRSELTPFGEKLLPGYRYLSPMFTDQGADEEGNAIGYTLLDVAATNTPFQDGVGLTFHRMGRAHKGTAMSDDLFKKLGLSDGCSADEMKGAMAKYMADMDEKLAKYADLEEKMSKFEDEKKAEAEKMAAPFEGKESPEEEKAEDEAKEKMAKDLGLEPGAKLSKVYAAFSAKMVPMSKLAETEKRLAALEAERAAEKQAALEIKYGELADKGIAAGYSKEKRDDLIKFARADFDAAKSFVESLPGAKVLSRITSGGSPLGTVRAETAAPESPDVNGSRLPVRQASFAERARKYAKEHNLKGLEGLRQAQRAVLAQDPSAADDLF